jgi:hypothetical protein
MGDQLTMRASDRDRQQVVDRLRSALEDGRLTMDEYVGRMEAAYKAATYGDLVLEPGLAGGDGASVGRARAERGEPCLEMLEIGVVPPEAWHPELAAQPDEEGREEHDERRRQGCTSQAGLETQMPNAGTSIS